MAPIKTGVRGKNIKLIYSGLIEGFITFHRRGSSEDFDE